MSDDLQTVKDDQLVSELRGLSSRKKWLLAVLLGVLFIILSSPYIYELLDDILYSLGVSLYRDKTPTTLGLVVMSVVFILVVRLMMR